MATEDWMEQRQASTASVPTWGVVAIVEDDLQMARALGAWLELHGLRVAYHFSGESLLLAIHQEAGGNRLLLSDRGQQQAPLLGAVLDLNLPGVTGIELAYSLKGLLPDLPLAIITALRENERGHFGELPPGVACLTKPFDLEALENALFPLLH